VRDGDARDEAAREEVCLSTGRRWPAACALVLTACGGGSSAPPILLEAVTTTSTTAGGSLVDGTKAGDVPLSAATVPDDSTTEPDGVVSSGPGAGSVTVATDNATTTTLPPLTPENAPRVQWQGGTDYLLGANLPWYGWGCDFGCGASAGGVSDPATSDVIGPALDSAKAAGMDIVRWWLFPGQPTQFTVDAAGLPNGIVPEVYEDIDAALVLADRSDVSYVFTLFSGPNDLPAAWLTTEPGRARLTEMLAVLFAHYRNAERIMTWQVMNEPEWDIWDGHVAMSDVQDLVRKVAYAVHAESRALVSVGGARLDGLPIWQGLGLDYYTVHWYDPMKKAGECLPCVTYAQIRDGFGIDAPIVVGEFYLGPDVDGDARLDSFRAHGYAGSFAWSLMPDRTADHLTIDLEAAARFATRLEVDG
jgi:hypothetical protein